MNELAHDQRAVRSKSPRDPVGALLDALRMNAPTADICVVENTGSAGEGDERDRPKYFRARSAWSNRFPTTEHSGERPLLYFLKSRNVRELSAVLAETNGRGVLCNTADVAPSVGPQGVHPALPLWLSGQQRAIPFDPASEAEAATIARFALHHLYVEGSQGFCYMALHNRAISRTLSLAPEHAQDAFRGMYRLDAPRTTAQGVSEVRLCGAGSALHDVVEAQALLSRDWNIMAEVWSCPSYTRLAREGHAADTEGLLGHLDGATGSHVRRCLGRSTTPVIAVTKYMQHIAAQIGAFVRGRFLAVGADSLRPQSIAPGSVSAQARWITLLALKALADDGYVSRYIVRSALQRYEVSS